MVQEDIRTRMKAGESLVDLMAPMTSTMASMVDSLVAPLDVSLVASMVASKASMVASMAPLVASMASMVEALDWLKRVTAESESDDERVNGLFDGLARAVTWARMKRAESLVDLKALMTLIALTMTMMVATMVAPRVSSQGKEEITTRDDRDGIKKRCQSGRRCHDPKVALTVDLMMEASMVASMASMVASRVSVVASMASMASLVESRKWLKRRAAEPKRDDERVNGLAHSDELTLKIDGALTVAMMMASMAATMVAPEASMALLVASMASVASMVASLDRLRHIIEPKSGEERVDGLSHKICEERADELTIKIDGERVGR